MHGLPLRLPGSIVILSRQPASTESCSLMFCKDSPAGTGMPARLESRALKPGRCPIARPSTRQRGVSEVADENVDQQIVQALREAGEEVWTGSEQASGLSDEELLQRTENERSVLITADKDF